jgi:hypothetical protein
MKLCALEFPFIGCNCALRSITERRFASLSSQRPPRIMALPTDHSRCGEADATSPAATPNPDCSRILSSINQTAPRIYTQQVLCFAFDDVNQASLERMEAHLRGALRRLAQERPNFAGRLRICGAARRPGSLCVRLGSCQDIPLAIHDIRDEFDATYEQLRAGGFPAKAFVHERFVLNGGLNHIDQAELPVFQIRIYVIRGGLLLVIAFHHALIDGECARAFIENFAAQTRNQFVAQPQAIDLALRWGPLLPSGSQKTLFDNCAEYRESDGESGPSAYSTDKQEERAFCTIGKIFVFSQQRLDSITDLLARHWSWSNHGQRPSTYVTLAALTWAHAGAARTAVETDPEGKPAAHGHWASILHPVNWRAKCSAQTFNKSTYFGNATVAPTTSVPVVEVSSATRPAETVLARPESYEDDDDHDNVNAHRISSPRPSYLCKPNLAQLARKIHQTIHSVDEDFVSTRLALFESLDDPRKVGMNWTPSYFLNFGFNTWHHRRSPSIADTTWYIPGVPSNVPMGSPAALDEKIAGSAGPSDMASAQVYAGPDSAGRVQGKWGFPGAVMLPRRQDADTHRLLITLPVATMEHLCRDPEWMSWVSQVMD